MNIKRISPNVFLGISLGILLSLSSVQVLAFSDIGTSKLSCRSAERDAQVIAQSHCFSLDTKAKMKMGHCKKRKVLGKRQFRVPVYYKCMVQTARFDYN